MDGKGFVRLLSCVDERGGWLPFFSLCTRDGRAFRKLRGVRRQIARGQLTKSLSSLIATKNDALICPGLNVKVLFPA